MLGTTVLDKYFQVIEIAFFFGLCGLSVYFTYGVLDQFISGRVCNTIEIKSLPPSLQNPQGPLPKIIPCPQVLEALIPHRVTNSILRKDKNFFI